MIGIKVLGEIDDHRGGLEHGVILATGAMMDERWNFPIWVDLIRCNGKNQHTNFE